MAVALANLEINKIIEDSVTEMHAFQINDLKLRQISRALDKLWDAKLITPAQFHIARGFIAAARHDRVEAVAAVKNALQLAPRDPIAQANALSVFSTFCCVRDAVSLMELMFEQLPDNKSALRDIILHASELMQYQLAARALARYDNISMNTSAEASERRINLISELKMAKEYDFKDEDLAALIETAVDAVRARGREVYRNSRTKLRNNTSILYLHVDADPLACAHLNFDIADALVEKFEDTKADVLTIMCRPLNDIQDMVDLEGTYV